MEIISAKTIAKVNNFNLMRFLFASLVLVSHSYELLDGSRVHEPLTVLFGSLSFGEVAVDAFFLLSGFLIAKSWASSPSIRTFVVKRVLRIVPGFVVAYMASLLFFGLIGWRFDFAYYKQIVPMVMLKNLILLHPPDVAIAFPGSNYDLLNGSMWTIQFEFACYIFLCAVGVSGLFSRRWPVIGLAIALITANIVVKSGFGGIIDHYYLSRFIRLSGVFLAGSVYFVYIERIRFEYRIALFAVVFLIALMYSRLFAEAAFSVAGGYLLLFLSFRLELLKKFSMAMPDYSYGIYLYGWPAQKVVISFFAVREPMLVILLSLLMAIVFGALSWYFIERPFMLMKWRVAGAKSLSVIQTV